MLKKIICSLPIILSTILITTSLYPQVHNGFLNISNPETVYSTKGLWRFHFGDNPAWADPNMNDKRWTLKKFPSRIDFPLNVRPQGWFWYRLHIGIAPAVLDQGPLFLSLSRGYHTYELYINGKKHLSLGTLPDNGKEWKYDIGGRYIIINPQELSGTRNNILALRIYDPVGLPDSIVYNYGYIGLYSPQKNMFMFTSLVYYLLSAIAILIGLYHMFIMKRGSDKTGLLFAFYALSHGATHFFAWSHDTLRWIDTPLLHAISIAAPVLTLFWFTLFLYSFFIERLARLKYPIHTIAGFLLIIFIALLLARDLLFVSITYYGILISLIVNTPLLLYLFISELRRGRREIAPMLTGYLFVTLCIAIDIAQFFDIGPLPLPYFLWHYHTHGLIIFTITVSLSLSKRLLHVPVKKSEKKQKKVPLDQHDREQMERLLKNLMEEKKIYTDEKVSLNQLAFMISVHPNQLSEYLNVHCNTNFYTFINRYRIEEAKRLLIQEPESSVISIAYQVGFNSLSKFYQAFKKMTGMKPIEYRRWSMTK